MPAIPVTDKVNPGRNAWRSCSHREASAPPMGPEKPMGSTFHHTAKAMSSSRASQKAGVLEMVRQKPRTSLSGHRPRLAPASAPRASPSAPDSTQAHTSIPREADNRCPMTSSTGRR